MTWWSLVTRFLLVVALGALIGYLTNWLAIRALFRPRRPITIFGWNLPLTPGVIPGRREDLARALAEVVEQELLTQEAIDQEVDNVLSNRLDPYLEPTNLLGDRFGGLLDRFLDRSPFPGDSLKQALRDRLQERLTRLIRDHLDFGDITRQRVQSMDLEQLESVVLSVAHRELRWICWFGALLGALIGLLQAAVLLAIP